MNCVIAGLLVPAGFCVLAAAFAPAPAAADEAATFHPIPARTVCDADGRCYETGDPGYRDDDAPPPRRRYDPRDDDDRPPPPPRRRYDPDDDDRPRPPPRRRYDPDGDN